MKLLATFLSIIAFCQTQAQTMIATKSSQGAFPLVSLAQTATIVVDKAADSLVQKASLLFQADIEKVTGKKPDIATSLTGSKTIVLIGNIQQSALIQQLVKSGKLTNSKTKNTWEGYQIQTIKNPFQGVDQALVIAGNDRRGTAYGVMELSKQIGVSPWYWWADVPVKKTPELYVKAGVLTDAPGVKYRGIFLNDEAPALSGWSKEKFGGFNHLFYEKVFELMLRLKANYIWPAMWGNAFYDDDPMNRKTAADWGIVIGTSHHEPLMRAHDEWRRYGSGKWNYDSNAVQLKDFWKGGMQRATDEKIVSVGMRGDGDEPMSRETATALLERIVADQRQIIEQTTGKPAAETPQLWALYKEVQDYYDKGMRVPDDVTLLLCDDNWGNIRRLPKLSDLKRAGGYGIYYHFDYVGGPRNYKWLNTNNLARVWEQMHLAWEYDARQIWIVNVGDLKPMELPISFFLDYAWNPTQWNESNLRDYYTQWAAQQFGSPQSKEIGHILRQYAQLSARRKPELLDAATYSLNNYDEAGHVVKEWNALLSKAEKIDRLLPHAHTDAYFQLVLHPVKAMTNLHEMYWNVALNGINAKDSNMAANQYADAAKELYLKDSLIGLEYHRLGGGKWNHMMAQTHIGYTYWQQPPVNKMPALTYVTNGRISDTSLNTAYKIPSARGMIPKGATGNLFFEQEGYVSMEAAHYTKAVHAPNIRWTTIPDIGRTGSAVTTFPVTATATLGFNSPHLQYEFYTYDSGNVSLQLYFSPTLNFHNTEGLRYAVSVDDGAPEVLVLNKEDNNLKVWERWVADNIIIKKTAGAIAKPGRHTLKYWALSPGIVLQKLVVDFGGVKPSYLGPTETIIKK